MRNFFLFCFIFFSVSSVSAQTSKNIIRGVTRSTEELSTRVGGLAEQASRGLLPQAGNVVLSKGVQTAVEAGTSQPVLQPDVSSSPFVPQVSPRVSAPASLPKFSTAPIPSTVSVASVERAAAAEMKHKPVVGENQFPGVVKNFGRSVLFSPREIWDRIGRKFHKGGFTVTVVKGNYQGKEEIGGIVQTHLLPTNSLEEHVSLPKKFEVNVLLPDGTTKTGFGEVVQISPRSMLDISYVKFDKSIEPFLEPLEISAEIEEGEELLSYGYAKTKPVSTTSTVIKTGFIYGKVNGIDFEGGREGYCSSPWINQQGKVVMFHSGSGSYGTRASFVDKLVEAYHNGGKAEYDLMLNEEKIAKLNIDEYISAFGLADENHDIIFLSDGLGSGWDVFKKYSESAIRTEIILHPEARYLVLDARKALWKKTEEGTEVLVEDRTPGSEAENHLREIWYDLKLHEPEMELEENSILMSSLL